MSRFVKTIVLPLVVFLATFGLIAAPVSASPLYGIPEVSPANLELPNPCNGEDVVLNGTDRYTPLPNGSFRDVITLSGTGSFGNQYSARSVENFLNVGATVHTVRFRISSPTAPSFTERILIVHTDSGVQISHDRSFCS